MDIETQKQEIVQNQEIIEEQPQNKNEIKEKGKKARKSETQNKFSLLTCPYSNYTPSKIESMTYDETSQLLAVAREDCSIDIYHYPSWNVRHRFLCDKDSPIRRVKWITIDGSSKFLVVAHVNCLLSIYDLKSQRPIVTKNTNGNAIWDIAVSEDMISIACDDGGVIVYKYEGEDDLFVFKNLRQCQERVLSLAYDSQNPKILYAGYEKGYVRKHDIKQGTVTVTMNIDKDEMVWSLLAVDEDNLIVGGSSGNVFIFESKFGTLLSQLKTHEADITSLIINSTRDVVYATGLDSKIVGLEKISSKNIEGKSSQESWIISSYDRGQSHDISALVLLTDDVLVSGGVTTDVCIYNLERGRFKERKTSLMGTSKKDIKLRHITSLPWTSSVSHCDARNLVAFTKNFSVEIWNYEFSKMEYNFLIEIKSKSSPIIAFAISGNSKFIAYSTLEETTIFKYDPKKLELQKVKVIEPSTSLQFSQISNLLVRVDLDSKLSIFDLTSNQIVHTSALQTKHKGTFIESDTSSISSAVAFGSRISNEIFVFEPDTKNLIKIPALMEGHHYSAFKILAKKLLVIAYENNKFVEYDWSKKSLSDWTIQNINNFPLNYINKYNRIIGILPNPIDSTKYILYTNYYMIKIRTTEEIPKKSITVKPGSKTSKSSAESGSDNFKILYREKPIIKLQNLSDEIICVEYSWKEFASALPGAINAKKYGL